jgi:orotate phosphoribosyltransferase
MDAPSTASWCAKRKDHDTERKIDRNFKPDTNVILFDDVTERGSVTQAVRARGASVKKIITLVDRLEGPPKPGQRGDRASCALYDARFARVRGGPKPENCLRWACLLHWTTTSPTR